MKPIYLEFCGINSFSEKAEIDFQKLLSGGVFGIFGDTGSGKSTILDSIHLALYGQVERAAKANDCINYKADSAYVIFDFEIVTGGKRHTYRVHRERKRKNNQAKAYLYEKRNDGEWGALAEGTRDVDDALNEIIGLSFADFKMCIALPQGDFAALVKAPTADRVKLVSRLFDLEKYGEKLWRKVGQKYDEAYNAVEIVKAEMGQNEGGSDELIAQKREELAQCETQLKAAETRFVNAEKVYENALVLEKAKKEYDGVCQKLENLQTQLPQMKTQQAEIELLPKAKAVLAIEKQVLNNETTKTKAKKEIAFLETVKKRCEEELQQAKQRFQDGDFDEKIVQTTLNLQKVREATDDFNAQQKAKKELDDCIKEYNAIKNKCFKEDFDGLQAALEKELADLGNDDNFLEYLKHNAKGVLLSETYSEVRADLRMLAEKHPTVANDVAQLLEKYSIEESSEQNFDVEQLVAKFKIIEQQRKNLKTKVDDVIKRRQAYESNEADKNLLVEKGKLLRMAYDAANEKIALVKDLGTAEQLQKMVGDLQNAKTAAQNNVEKAQEKLQLTVADVQKQQGVLETCENVSQQLQTQLETALQESEFASVEEARALVEKLGDEETIRQKCKAFFTEYALYQKRYDETDKTQFLRYDEGAAQRALQAKQDAQNEKDVWNRKFAAAETEVKRLLDLKEKYKDQQKELRAKEKQRDLCDELRKMISRNQFLEFIASEYLQEICEAASKTLLSLTNGRYVLQYDKEFKVGDNLDAGNLRAVKTLSGGETFLVSLSLALSLSGAICQKSMRPIEFFFLDEGFGTLDEKLVDVVMDVLGKLSKNFAIGLISHVEELKHRIDNKILVTGATEQHGSKLQLTAY
ncbi:MAG: SMC family ATPase [Clostridiales bacterium]|nr:SMC family ATPase [Clostridiales bacterium]